MDKKKGDTLEFVFTGENNCEKMVSDKRSKT